MPETKRAYLEKHQLREIMTQTMNDLLEVCPEDPYGYLVIELARRATDAPTFDGLRATAFPFEDCIKCNVLATVRGLSIRAHTMSLPRSLFDPPEPLEGEGENAEGEEEEEGKEPCRVFQKRELKDLAKVLRESIGDQVLRGCSFDDFGEMQRKIFSYLCSVHHGDLHPDTAKAVAAELLEHVLQAAANTMKTNTLGYAHHLLKRSRVETTPRLEVPQDFETWECNEAWPYLGFEILSGGEVAPVLKGASLRVCLCFSPFAAAAPGSASAERCTGAGMGDLPSCPALNFVEALCFLGSACLEQAKGKIASDKAAAHLIDATQTPPKLYAPMGLEHGLEFVRGLAEAAVP